MGLQDHPGFFSITSRGVIAIHADWPMYPEEHGPDLALMWLTAFPQQTRFRRIDDIDRCNLFLANVKCSNHADPFDKRNFHVAVWNEDLLDLRESSFIDGVSLVSERRRDELKRADLPSGPLCIKLEDGTFREVRLPPLADHDRNDQSWLELSSGGLAVTPSGRDYVGSLLSEAADDLAILGPRISRLLDLGFFDTAVRDACVALEHHLKSWLKSDRWGDSLVEEFVSWLRESDNFPNTRIWMFRGQIRTAFKFIRNDFMHNFVDVDETQARAVLFRIARVQSLVAQLTTGA